MRVGVLGQHPLPASIAGGRGVARFALQPGVDVVQLGRIAVYQHLAAEVEAAGEIGLIIGQHRRAGHIGIEMPLVQSGQHVVLVPDVQHGEIGNGRSSPAPGCRPDGR